MNDLTGLYRLREIPIDVSPDPVLEPVLAYWNRLRGARFAPGWRDFDLTQLSGRLLRDTVVVDLQAPPLPIKYRYYGSGVAQSHGFELTGKTSDDIFPEDLRRHIVGQYETVRAARAPKLFQSDIFVKDGVPMRNLVLRLPLSNDGETVTGVVTVEHRYTAADD